MGTRFLAWFLTFTLAGLAAAAALNALIDPTSYLTNAGFVAPSVCTPGIRADERQSKLIAVRAFAPKALLVGTSQVGVGFDARDPVLRETLGRTYNLGISGLGTAELGALLRQTLPALRVRRVIVGVNFGMTIDFDIGPARRTGRIAVHDTGSLRFLKTALFSREALFASVRALLFPARCSRPSDRLDGTTLYRYPQIPPAVNEKTFARAFFRTARGGNDVMRNYRRHLADIADAASYLCARGIAVDLVILPNHARRLEVWSLLAGDARMDRWKRDMTALAAGLRAMRCAVAVWDFGYHNEVTTADFASAAAGDPSFPYWENSHFRTVVGHRVLQRILLGSGGEFGVKLTPETVEAQIARAGRARDAWRRAHPDVVAELARLVRQAAHGRRWNG